ncbi:aldehyde dehydrogenase [Clostridium tepidiprofundi DSM 19306]|uniref:Aldehyde dehydrogenase n=1 Tax=Clostridium tepidiprofundi DSM 19306 TaxID=1121338 RepID=A0A151B2L5_9CLOT|nr:aldehyde dehydrogenase family protein [Clostridium tepidiprofundi]KYH34136.1 aldehyde dehydrogenase [Clostridium tepidiprofundi DSM 19306]
MSTIKMVNPSNGDVLGEIKLDEIETVSIKMEKARNSFKVWSQISIDERIEYLYKMRKYLIENGEKVAEDISKATGKPPKEAYITEVFPVIDALKYYEKKATEILKPKRVKTPIHLFGKKSYIKYKPMGVIAVIAPWNYPFQLAMIPMISALVSGNTVIVKPSSVTAYVGIIMENIFREINIPDGVLQVLHGGSDIGNELVHSRPNKIFFTGSTKVGKIIMKAASEQLIPVELELGGKDPMIVLEDANLERAVNGALWGALSNSGQTCLSIERVYVHENIYTNFINLLSDRIEKLRQGYGDGFDIGSMTSINQIDIIKEQLEDALDKGAKILKGGTITDDKRFITPTILTDVNHDMKIMKEETFGPIIPVMVFRTEEEAIKLANDSEFGLGASVWSRDLEKAKRVADKIETGNICINDVIMHFANMNLPFGGIKQSGIGRYHSSDGIYAFCNTVSVLVDKGKKLRESNWYPYSKLKMAYLKRFIKFKYGK